MAPLKQIPVYVTWKVDTQKFVGIGVWRQGRCVYMRERKNWNVLLLLCALRMLGLRNGAKSNMAFWFRPSGIEDG